ALFRRADLTALPTWQALLLVDAAKLLLAEGEAEQALAALERAIGLETEVTFFALLALEELGLEEERDDVVARALEAQAALIVAALDNDVAANTVVPRYRKSLAYAVDAWLRAGYAHRRNGDLEGATRLLEQASERVPADPTLLHARLSAADAAGDTLAAAGLARDGLERGARGPLAAALWLRVAEGAAAQGDGAASLEAVRKALQEDPDSVPVQALHVDLLANGQQPPALAAALEATAERFGVEEAKVRMYLLAAEVWARLCQDRQGARAALSQAGMYGAPPGTVARVARMLAALTDDSGWYEEATRRLLAAGAAEHHQSGLWFELVRARLLRGDSEAAVQALQSLSSAPGGAWLGRAMGAYLIPLAKADDTAAYSTRALLELCDLTSDPQAVYASKLLVARRFLLANDRALALSHLTDLHQADCSNAVVTTFLAGVLRMEGRLREAAQALSACAVATQDPELRATFQLEAGILSWRAGDRSTAIECLAACGEPAEQVGKLMLGWALRAAEPNELRARRWALDVAMDGIEPALTALERFGLEIALGRDADDAQAALDAVGPDAPEELQDAARLARALWTPPGADPEDDRVALDRLGAATPAVDRLAQAARYQLECEHQADPALLEQVASVWAAVDPSNAAALAWFAASAIGADREQEVAARSALARRVGGDSGLVLESSARLVLALTDSAPPPLLTDRSINSALVNLELALPGSDPRRRAAALDRVDCALGEDSAALAKALLGYNQLVQGDTESALASFRVVVEAFPQEIIGWEGLRTAAEAAGDRVVVAEACAALGDAVHDDALGAELWEQAALILIEELGDPERGEFALSRAVERHVGRSVAFDRLFRIVRARKDGPRLLELITRRLDVAEDPDELVKLFWERARVLRKQGSLDEALTALESVTMLEPDHVGALALSGEIYINRGLFGEAALKLARLAALADAPQQQRLVSGMAAVDLYENKLGESQEALKVLTLLYRADLSTLPVRERLAKTAARVGAWVQAAEVLEALMMERVTAEGRIEAARLAMAIYRDRVQEPAQAERAVRHLLSESPEDGEALDFVLSEALPEPMSRESLQRGKKALVTSLSADPLDPERVDRLARIAVRLENAPLRQAMLGALVALGRGTQEIDDELRVLEDRVARLPQIAIDEAALPDLCDPEDGGALPALFDLLAPVLAEALGPSLVAFGIAKKHKVDPKIGFPLRNEVAAWAGALGLGDFDLYLGGKDEQGIFGVAAERASLVVGSGIGVPLLAEHRQAVARELFALKRGTTILQYRDPGDVAALIVAACGMVGYTLPAPHYAMLDEFTRQLSRGMSRRVRKELPGVAARIAAEQPDSVAWVRAATASLDRLAALAAGDVSHVLAAVSGTRGKLGVSAEGRARTARLLAFVMSPSYLKLREQLGMGVR
ncbi:hypothetical protein ACFL5O_02645, partial [Myxococcota bacterium]